MDNTKSTILSSTCILAPLAGVSDLPFRMINRGLGCSFAFLPMISARALVYQNKNTEKMLSTIPSDRPLGIQLLGNDPDILKRALEITGQYQFDVLDFNAACPVRKVTSRGEGASLLKEPDRLGKLLRVMVDNSDVPVSLKIRAGWDASSVNALNVALNAQDAGVKLLWIHGRTREQGYGGEVNYQVIRKIKDVLDIPVIGSGNALTPKLIKKMLDETGCDSVGIARGALGNPWIFRQTDSFLEKGMLLPDPDLKEIKTVMTRHLNLCCDYYGEKNGAVTFRKYFIWYTRGFKNIKPLRKRAFLAATQDQMTGIIENLSKVDN